MPLDKESDRTIDSLEAAMREAVRDSISLGLHQAMAAPHQVLAARLHAVDYLE